MRTLRKLSLRAMGVIAIALPALTLMTPASTVANPCPYIFVPSGGSSCPVFQQWNQICQANAPPGCSVTSSTCGSNGVSVGVFCWFN